MKNFFATRHDVGMFLLRIGAGAAILPYGIQKVQGFEGTMQFMTGAGIPWIIALLVVIAESVGALSLIIGFCTRFCAASLAVIMVGAIYFVFGQGFFAGYSSPTLFLLLFIPLIINGGGAWSADGEIAKKVA